MKASLRPAVILFTVFLFTASFGYSQSLETVNPAVIGFSEDRLKRLDEKFTSYVSENKMAGSVILISRKGKVGYHKAFGFRDKESNSKMDPGSIFRIASQTKAIVSVGIMILQEEGKLLIKDPVSKYIPAFKETTVAERKSEGGYNVVKAKREITLRDLLTHTAGVGYGDGVAADAWKKAGIQGWYFADRNEPIATTIERMAKLPMDAHPGEHFVYGYATDILGVVIERASGMSLDKFLQAKIFEPLGMSDTHFYLPKEKANRLATVYSPAEGAALKPAPRTSAMDGQGEYVDGPRKSFSGGAGLLSTARDYHLFLQMIANGGELNGKRILSSRTVDLMTKNHLGKQVTFGGGLGFGLGLEVVLDQGQTGTHGSVGTLRWGGAYGSTYWIDPAEELIVVYFTQLRPNSIVEDQAMLRNLVYQALVD